MIGRGIQREYPGVGGTTNFYKIIEKINVDLNTSDQYIEEIILTHKFKNNIFTSPEIQSICETDSWKVFGVLKEMQESQKICPIGYTGRNAIAYKLNPTKEDLEMSEKFMKDKLIEKLGYLPPLKEVARITVMETQWPRGIFTARDVAKASGLPRYSISSSLNDLKSEGIIEVIGRTGKSLNVYRIIKKEDQL
jgi:predicted HTH transcriptional regulator